MSSGEKPFHDIDHDKELALRIVKGLRPEITKHTPPFYQDLMQKCWHSDPTQRPTAKQIYELTRNWHPYPTKEIEDQIKEAEKIRQENIEIKKVTQTHSGAIYTSRLLTNITKGKEYFGFDFIEIQSLNLIPFLELASINLDDVDISDYI